MSEYAHVLLAVDFSPASTGVGRRAVQLSGLFNATLTLIHVVEYMPVDLSNEMLLPQAPEIDRQLIELAERRLKDLATSIGAEHSGRLVRQGHTKREILRYAEENGVDLIVIGSHGREGMQLLLGSTANAVLHGAPCDVLAVRVRD
jgi:universal stress protein A